MVGEDGRTFPYVSRARRQIVRVKVEESSAVDSYNVPRIHNFMPARVCVLSAY